MTAWRTVDPKEAWQREEEDNTPARKPASDRQQQGGESSRSGGESSRNGGGAYYSPGGGGGESRCRGQSWLSYEQRPGWPATFHSQAGRGLLSVRLRAILQLFFRTVAVLKRDISEKKAVFMPLETVSTYLCKQCDIVSVKCYLK